MNSDISDTTRWSHQSDELFTKLVQAIGKQLGYNIEQLDIFRGGYAPRGWEITENEQQTFRRLAIELLEGKRSMSIANMHNFGNSGFYPPPPKD